MNLEGKRITDERGQAYELERKLGEGGQGAVYSAKGGKRAIKILFNSSSNSRRELLRGQLQNIRRMPELRGLAIARPLEMLQAPYLGYVMELITGMVPISRLSNPPRELGHLAEWYLSGGGLRRRLLLLARCAEVLAQLHSKGLVYSDPSPNNIFVSTDLDAHEIRLIDADNLHYESSSSTRSFHTPGYGAPELVLGKSGVNSLTDAHAFAVIAFQTLCLVHPLMGDLVLDGEPELEEKALQGSLPWVDDPSDQSNATHHGFPRDIVLSPKLKKLCQRCFSEGLREPTKRPGISQWVEDLYSAADFTVECPDCGSTYYANQPCCPWCDYPRPLQMQLLIKRWEPLPDVRECQRFLSKQKILAALALTERQPLILTNRIINGRTGADNHIPAIKLQIERTNVRVRSLNGQCFWLSSFDGEQRTVVEVQDGWKRFPANDQRYTWLLHFAPTDRPHRLATFRFVSGEHS